MRLYEFQKVREMVRRYNETGLIKETAYELKLPVADTRDILDWLWNYQDHLARMREQQRKDCGAAKSPKPFFDCKHGRKLKPVKVAQYLAYLYEKNVAPEDAADLVGWTLAAVLETHGGPREWNKLAKRKKIVVPAREPEQRKKDPTPDEIVLAVAELRRGWTPEQLLAQERRGRYKE